MASSILTETNLKTKDESTSQRCSRGCIHVVSDNLQSGEAFAKQIGGIGFCSSVFESLQKYTEDLANKTGERPAALFYLLNETENAVEKLNELQDFATFEFFIPVVVCGYDNRIEIRLATLRAGAQCYLKRPISESRLQETLTDLSLTQPNQPYKVLLIDDSAITLEIHANILTEAGLQVTAIENPLDALTKISMVHPEVIVLDVYMPQANGFEIAAILRDQEEFRDIPILFVSSESDILTELHALSLGGDDFYVKPVEPRRFVNGVTARAKVCRRNNIARQRLRRILYERDLEHMALNNHALVSVTDLRGNILLANKKFSEVSGYSHDELLGSNHRIIKSGFHDENFYKNIWKTISSGLSWQGEICNKAKDGSLYWVDSTISPMLNENGKPYQYIAIRTDITALKLAETNFKNARDQAEKANKAKSEFLANMSHELRTPLNAIVGFSQLLESSDDLSDENHDDVEEIIKASKHLLGLINDVLDLAKIEAGKLEFSIENVLIMAIIRECITMITPMAQKRNITIDCEGHEELCVKCDRGRFKQALLNLLSNAIKYNVENGSVQISFDCVQSGYLQIRIKDSGIGIAQDSLSSIFKPFSRLELQCSEIEGTGIGLSLTRQLIEQMGGRVGVESKLHSGSTFWVELPTSVDNSEENDSATDAMDGNPEEKNSAELQVKQLVYIDDHITNLKLMNNIVGKMPEFNLNSFQSPLEGLKFVMKNKPDLVLLDIHMPQMNGYEVLRAMQADKHCQSIPAIAVSANALLRDVEEGLLEGFCEYVTKPFDVNHLKGLIRKHALTDAKVA